MNTETARQMMDAARTSALALGKGVSIAIVDAGGNLMSLERVNDAAPATTFIAEAKAVASAMMGRDSGRLAPMAERFPAILEAVSSRVGGRFLAVQGAVVVLQGTATEGAVGVSGATSEEDEAIARAGAEAFSA
jgi:glc operon protein GlcG